MRSYETAFLIAPTLPEEEIEKLIDKMAGIISKKKGKMIHVDKWGKRRLAYPIEKFKDAFYVFFQYSGEPEIPAELERNFKQTEDVIRYLTIKLEERANIRRKKEKPKGKRAGGFEEHAREASPSRRPPQKETPQEKSPEKIEKKDSATEAEKEKTNG